MTNNNGTASWLEANINGDPLFTGTGDHPHALTADSPCRNAGTPDTTGLFLPQNDLAGNPRIWEELVDLGAYEWNNVGIDESAVGGRQSAVESFPNPFSTSTTIEYEIKEAGPVSLKIFNNIGQEVITLVNEHQSKGTHQVKWNADGMPAGIYCCRLTTDDCRLTTGKLVKY